MYSVMYVKFLYVLIYKNQIDYSIYRDSIRLEKTKKKRYVLYRGG